MPEILRFHHLSLTVTDLARSTQWYQSVLGLNLVAEIEGEGFSRMRLRAPHSGTDPFTDSSQPVRRRALPTWKATWSIPGLRSSSPGDVGILKRRFEELGEYLELDVVGVAKGDHSRRPLSP